jgi:hypothetical protein
MIGQILGAGGQHLGVGGRQLPVDQGLGGAGQRATVQGLGGAHQAAGRAGAHAEAGPQPAGGGAGLDAGEFGEPVAFEAVHQPPQGLDPLGPGAVG